MKEGRVVAEFSRERLTEDDPITRRTPTIL